MIPLQGPETGGLAASTTPKVQVQLTVDELGSKVRSDRIISAGSFWNRSTLSPTGVVDLS
jgi:hypothetical protein